MSRIPALATVDGASSRFLPAQFKGPVQLSGLLPSYSDPLWAMSGAPMQGAYRTSNSAPVPIDIHRWIGSRPGR
jgi:hypothetical protein